MRGLLALVKHGPGIGVTQNMHEANEKPVGDQIRSLLNGSAEIGLAVLAAVSDVEPAWDRCMLLDMPPCSA